MGGRVCMKIRRSKNKVLRVCIHKLPQYGAAKAANAEGVGEREMTFSVKNPSASLHNFAFVHHDPRHALCSETVKQRVFFSSCARAA